MLFVIDIGNSHTVIGLYEDDVLKAQWRLTSDRAKTPDEIGIQFHTLFSMAGITDLAVNHIVMASVVPSLEAAWLKCCDKHFSNHLHSPPFIVNHRTLAELIEVKIDYPSEVGADRLVNSIGAWSELKTDLMVIDFGTAITFDCVTAHCEYLGGVIVPGIAISLEALATRTAKLPHIDITTPPANPIGKNTVDAMKSGILHGYGVMIDGLVETLSKELQPNGGVHCLATGGMAEIIIPYSRSVTHVDQLLTLKGLHHIHTKVRSNT